MDLEQCSKSSFSEVEDVQKHETLGKLSSFDENNVEINGKVAAFESGDGEKVWHEIARETLSEAIGSTTDPMNPNEDGDRVENSSPTPAPRKGYGLKRWRRIRRDTNKETSSGADPGMVLKRRLPLAERPKAQDESKTKSDLVAEVEVEAEESVASLNSVNAVVVGMASHEVAAGALGSELEELVTSSGFSVGADPESSEDWSSKPSVNANVLRPRHETGFGSDRSRPKGSGRGSGHVVQQRGQRGRGNGMDAGKKVRGDRVRFEKENSLSSVESDLRSSAAVVGWWQRGVVLNGKQCERSLNYDMEHSGDEGQTSGEVNYRENRRGEDLDADLAGESTKNSDSQLHSNDGPLVESITLLQAAQEALENEIHMFGDITCEPIPIPDDSYGQFEDTEWSSSAVLETHLIELNQNAENLERKLEEASDTVKTKELKVLELEALLNNKKPAKKDAWSSTDIQFFQEEHEKMEFELEYLIEKKIEAEIVFLTITRTMRNWKVLFEDQITLFEQQKTLLKEQSQMFLKLRDAENSAITLEGKVEKLEASCRKLLKTEDILKLQNRVCRFSVCCVQLLMLCIALALFFIQLLPLSNGDVPT